MEKLIDETRQGAPLSLEGDAKNTYVTNKQLTDLGNLPLVMKSPKRASQGEVIVSNL